MDTQRLVHSIGGTGAVRTAAFAVVIVLVPLRAWTEEAPRGEFSSSVAASADVLGSPEEATPAASPQGVPALPPTASELENPWRLPLDQVPAENHEQGCTPWSTSVGCTGELDLLLDPWLVAPSQPPRPEVLEGDPPIQSPPRPAPVAPAPPGALEAEHPPGVEPAPEAPRVAENSDSWVVDLSLPEAPFD